MNKEFQELIRAGGLMHRCGELIEEQRQRLGNSGETEESGKLLTNLIESVVHLARLREYIRQEVDATFPHAQFTDRETITRAIPSRPAR